MSLPSQARIVVIGGGAVGCSHRLSPGQARPERDVLVLEKSGLTHGSTWHAAGLVGQLRSKRNLTRLMQYSAQLYGKLEAETGQATEWKPVGSLRLASSRGALERAQAHGDDGAAASTSSCTRCRPRKRRTISR